jgi:hypothetical protein
MIILKAVLAELFAMFVSDAWLSTAVLAVVAVAALIEWVATPLWGGAALLLGCLALLIESVRRAARRSGPAHYRPPTAK